MLSRIGEDSYLNLICFVASKCVVTHVVTLCHAMLHGDLRNGHVKRLTELIDPLMGIYFII